MSVLTPYICVADSRQAIEWYAEALEAVVVVEPIVMPDGHVGHCELAVDGASWMMSDEFESAGVAPPDPARGSDVTLHLTVDDCDAVCDRARAGGARVVREPGDNPGVGRVAVFLDPFGHRWFLNQPES